MSQDYERILSIDWDLPRKPYPAKYVTLATGEKMVVREATRDEVPTLLEALRSLITVPRDYYDLVSVRQYAELLGWYRYRVRNEFCLVGVVDGKLAGIVNNRAVNEKLHMSLHTTVFKRGARLGAHLFAAKQEHSIETYGAEEVWVTAESPIGFRRWMIEWGMEERPQAQHELGGAKVWVITRDIYQKVKPKLVFGERPVPPDLLKSSSKLQLVIPDVVSQ